MFDIIFLPSIIAMGLLSGFLAGLLGIGGGIVLVPGLYYIFTLAGYESEYLMHIAVGTSLGVIVPTGLSSVRAHWKRGSVRPDILALIGPGIILGVGAGTVTAGFIEGAQIKLIFAVAIALLSLLMISDPSKYKIWNDVPGRVVSGLTGIGIGTLSVLIGVGGATMSVPFMRLSNVKMTEAVGTASALGLLISVPGAAGFLILGLVTGVDDPMADGLPPLTFGFISLLSWLVIVPLTILAAPFGARAAHAVSLDMLRRIFAGFMVIVAINMMADVLFR